MKNFSILFIILLFSFNTNAQKPGDGGTMMRLFENSRPFSLPDGEGNTWEIPLETIEGSPYLKEEFYPGKVFNGEENAGTFLIRYNVYHDVMEIQFENNSIQEVVINPDVKVSIGTSRFRVHKYLDLYNNLVSGYFEILEDGDKVDLLLKHTSEFTPGAPPISGNHKAKKPEFEYSKKYYLFFNDSNQPVEIKKLKEKKVLELLEDKSIAKDIIEKNSLDLKDEKDLRQLIIELNTTST